MKILVSTLILIAMVAIASIRTTATLLWDYPAEEATNVTFNLYFSTNLTTPMTNWTLLANVATTNVTVSISPGQGFYFATASNEFGESVPSNIAQATVARSVTGVKIR